MKCTMFFPPNAKKVEGEMTHIRPEDQAYFEANGVKISMEDINGNAVVYADTGHVIEGEPDEQIQISRGRSCEDTMTALRKDCERRFYADHLLYKDGDACIPDAIKDRNGQVVLSLCTVCGKGEAELVNRCDPYFEKGAN